MYCIKKLRDCWAFIDLDLETSRPLTVEEMRDVIQEIPALRDPGTAAWYCDHVVCINVKL